MVKLQLWNTVILPLRVRVGIRKNDKHIHMTSCNESLTILGYSIPCSNLELTPHDVGLLLPNKIKNSRQILQASKAWRSVVHGSREAESRHCVRLRDFFPEAPHRSAHRTL